MDGKGATALGEKAETKRTPTLLGTTQATPGRPVSQRELGMSHSSLSY
jgi:hypothetical protein